VAYGTITDIRDLGLIPDEDLDALDQARPTQIPRLFDAVSARFDTYLRPRYGVPMPGSPVPIELTDAVVAIVVARLYAYRGFPSIPEGSDTVKEILLARDHAEAFLKDIRDGVAQLDWTKDATPGGLEAGPSVSYALTPAEFKFGKSGCC